MRALILGAGSFGTAMGQVLHSKFDQIDLWCRNEVRAAELRAATHSSFPGVTLASNLQPISSLENLPQDYDVAIAAIPTQSLANVLSANKDHLPRDIPWVSVAKGLELKTHRRPSQIISDSLGVKNVSVLSGPSHAEEMVRDVPTAVVLANRDAILGRGMQSSLSSDNFRVYYCEDVIGVEVGGALKNVIAIAAGIAVGLGFGDNTLAALVTRGAVEIARLGHAMGADRQTFSGLSGVGDLVVTCFSKHSRNHQFGLAIGKGESPKELLSQASQVVEGAHTAQAAVDLGGKLKVDLPIAEEVFHIIQGHKNLEQGIKALLSRSLKEE